MKEMDDLSAKLNDLVALVKETQRPADGSKVLTLSSEQRQMLEQAFGINFHDSDHLVREMIALSSLNVGGIYVQLTPQLIERLKSRAFSMPFDKFVTMLVRRALEAHVGLR